MIARDPSVSREFYRSQRSRSNKTASLCRTRRRAPVKCRPTPQLPSLHVRDLGKHRKDNAGRPEVRPGRLAQAPLRLTTVCAPSDWCPAAPRAGPRRRPEPRREGIRRPPHPDVAAWPCETAARRAHVDPAAMTQHTGHHPAERAAEPVGSWKHPGVDVCSPPARGEPNGKSTESILATRSTPALLVSIENVPH